MDTVQNLGDPGEKRQEEFLPPCCPMIISLLNALVYKTQQLDTPCQLNIYMHQLCQINEKMKNYEN